MKRIISFRTRIIVSLALVCVAMLSFAVPAYAYLDVDTTQVSALSYDSATIKIYFDRDRGGRVSGWIEYGEGSNLNNDSKASTITTGRLLRARASNLKPNTTYSYRAILKASWGETATGPTMTFTTKDAPVKKSGSSNTVTTATAGEVSVYTKNAYDITDTEAILTGNVATAGGKTTVWFEWGVNGKLGSKTPKKTVASTEDHEFLLVNLKPETIYTYRIAAQNKFGIERGNVFQFRTQSKGYVSSDDDDTTGATSGGSATGATGSSVRPITTIGTKTPLIGSNGGTVYATVLPGGESAEVWFEYGPTNNLGRKTKVSTVTGTSQTVPGDLTGLEPGTKYYYRSVVKTKNGTAYSPIMSLTTKGVASSDGGNGGTSSSGTPNTSGAGSGAGNTTQTDPDSTDDTPITVIAVDSDGDGVVDVFVPVSGADAANATGTMIDTDGDGVADLYVPKGANENDPSSTISVAGVDTNGDGFPDEYISKSQAATKPGTTAGIEAIDTDGDGIADTYIPIGGALGDASRASVYASVYKVLGASNDTGSSLYEKLSTVISQGGGIYKWNGALASDYFGINKNGEIDRNIQMGSFQSRWAFANPFSGFSFLPDSGLEWLVVILVLYIGITTFHRYFLTKKKKEEEKKRRKREEEELKYLKETGLEKRAADIVAPNPV